MVAYADLSSLPNVQLYKHCILSIFSKLAVTKLENCAFAIFIMVRTDDDKRA